MMRLLIGFTAPALIIWDAWHQMITTGCAGITGITFLALAMAALLGVYNYR